MPTRMSGKKKALVITGVVIAALLLLWLAVEIAVPRIAASYVKKEIKKRYPRAGNISVSVSAFPALRMAFKDYDNLYVRVSDITLQDVNFDEIVLRSKKWPEGEFKAVIGQDEIIRFFSLSHSYVIDPSLTLEGETMRVNGKIDVNGLMVTVDATGTLETADGRQVFFKPGGVTVAGISSNEKGVQFVEQVMRENPVFTVRDDLPYTISSISARRDKLVIQGKVDLEKALNIKL